MYYLCKSEGEGSYFFPPQQSNRNHMKRIIQSIITSAAIILAASPVALAIGAPTPDVEALGIGTAADVPSLKATEGGIELKASNADRCVFAVYSITGQLVKTVEVAAASSQTVPLSGGCYIVRCSAWAKKIVVR